MISTELRTAFDLFDIEGGTQPPKAQFVYQPTLGYVRLLQIRDFESDGHDTYIPDSSKWRRCSTKDTLIGRYGAAVGRICRGLEGAYNVALAKVVPRDGIDPEYLHYLLRSDLFQGPLLAGSGRSAQAGFNKTDLKSIKLPVLPPAHQYAVGRLLRPLDDKIELNRRMNETLEAMARAIFKDWFVDFGPTRAKAEGRPPYLAPDLWAMFPDALDDEDKPVGWEDATLERLAKTNEASWTARRHPPTLEYLDLSNAKWGNIEGTAKLDWTDAPSRARRIAKIGDTVVGTTRPGNGSFSLIGRDGLTVSTGFAVLSPRSPHYRDAVYVAATCPENIRRLANLADGHGGAYPAVKPQEVSNTEMVYPGEAVLRAFDETVSPLRAKIEQSKSESGTLAQTRDLLLPKLMSGEIRLAEAEKAVEAVA